MTETTTSPLVTDAEAIELWGRVIAGFQATNSRVHAEIKAAFSLTEPEAETLLNLHRHVDHRASMARLARAAAFTSGGFTKIADRLTRRGLVARVACADDRRVTFLELTPEGVELAADLARLAAETNRAIFIDVLGLERARLLADTMTELHRANRESER